VHSGQRNPQLDGLSILLASLLSLFLGGCGTSVVGGTVTRTGNRPPVSEDFCDGRCAEFGPDGRCVRFAGDMADVCSRYLDRGKLPPAIEVVDTIRSVCLAPGAQGKYWEVEKTGRSDVNVRLLKKFPGAEGESEVRFSQGEWEGVQRVLKEQQAGDNADYRQCVRELSPLFVNRISPGR
jgi:hypothetical protein